MIPLRRVNWGPDDASREDDKFSSKWIEPPEIKNCLDHDRWIVTGEKGSGKSAIQRAMREIHSSDYYVTPVVDFDKLEFSAWHSNLIEISKTTNLEAGVMLSNYWQYSIIVELIKACAAKDPSLYGDLLSEHPVGSHRDLSFTVLLTKLIEHAWNWLDKLTQPRFPSGQPRADLVFSGGLDAETLHSLGEYPLDRAYENIRDKFFQRIVQKGHRATLVLDGFDTLFTYNPNAPAINLIFSSLVNAILLLRTKGKVPPLVGIKALIPHDRFMNVRLRDLDKVDPLRAAIRWNVDSLKTFLEKRILLTPGIRQGPFPALWAQIMPESVSNKVHAVEEDSFHYVMRHTMLRPRQIQTHLEMLASRYPDENISPSMIPNSIAESSKKLADFFFNEYSIDHPGLESLILRFQNKPAVMPFKELRDSIAAYIRNQGVHRTVNEEIDALYVMSVFGVVRFLDRGEAKGDRYYPPSKDGTQHYVDFFFREPHKRISLRLDDEEQVALHPIFVDYAGLRPTAMVIG